MARSSSARALAAFGESAGPGTGFSFISSNGDVQVNVDLKRQAATN